MGLRIIQSRIKLITAVGHPASRAYLDGLEQAEGLENEQRHHRTWFPSATGILVLYTLLVGAVAYTMIH